MKLVLAVRGERGGGIHATSWREICVTEYTRMSCGQRHKWRSSDTHRKRNEGPISPAGLFLRKNETESGLHSNPRKERRYDVRVMFERAAQTGNRMPALPGAGAGGTSATTRRTQRKEVFLSSLSVVETAAAAAAAEASTYVLEEKC